MHERTRGLGWGGTLLFGTLALLARWFDATTWPFVVGCLACASLVLWSWIRRYRLRAKLPEGLGGLWYRSQRGRIEFHWRWSEPSGGRLRILGSEGLTIRTADDVRDGVWRVFDGFRPCYATDELLRPGATYRYAFFVGFADGRWSAPVRQTITALSADDAAHIEASQRGPATVDPSGGAYGAFTGVQAPRSIAGVASVLITPLVDAAVDGVFDLIEGLSADDLENEGWTSVI